MAELLPKHTASPSLRTHKYFDDELDDDLINPAYRPRTFCGNPRLGKFRRLLILATCLFVVGIIMMIVGVIEDRVEFDGLTSTSYFIIGTVCLVPALYFGFFVYRSLHGDSGYRLEDLPGYNDDIDT
eukprot:m.54765 g.54765  ORF g.54765 m.54765 type:complete len:127 (-) comp13263_c0_seq3:331-711(-)